MGTLTTNLMTENRQCPDYFVSRSAWVPPPVRRGHSDESDFEIRANRAPPLVAVRVRGDLHIQRQLRSINGRSWFRSKTNI
jgi:hypothetical protein